MKIRHRLQRLASRLEPRVWRLLSHLYCRHERSMVVIWNPLTEPAGQQICVSWCATCGAIKRSFGIPDGRGNFVYTWCGRTPTWELPNNAMGIGERIAP